jgi:hypothetical protein
MITTSLVCQEHTRLLQEDASYFVLLDRIQYDKDDGGSTQYCTLVVSHHEMSKIQKHLQTEYR